MSTVSTTPPTGVAYHANPLPTILLCCLGYALFNVGDAVIKLLADKFHFSQIIVFNCIVIFAVMGITGWMREGKQAFVMKKRNWVLLRAALAVCVSVLNIAAFPHIQLTTFYTLVFTSPLWVALLSAFFLREKLAKHQIGAIVAGFAVIAFMFRPGGEALSVYSLMILAGAFLYSCSMVIMRHLGPTESRTCIILSGSTLSIIAMLPLMITHYVAPTPLELVYFTMIGITGGAGLFAVAYAFQNAPSAATVAPYHYTQIFWGAILGYMLFGDVPKENVMIGAALIIASGLYLIYSEAKLFKKKNNIAKREGRKVFRPFIRRAFGLLR